MAYTTTELLASVKSKALVPTSQTLFEDQDILDIASEKLEDKILPEIVRSRQEYYVFSESRTVIKGASDQYGYLFIPERAIGMSIITLKDSSYNELSKAEYWLEGSKIMFASQAASTSIRIYYHLRPGKLVTTSDVATIISFDPATGAVTISSVPTTFSTSVKYDFLRAKSGFDALAIDKTASAVQSTTAPYTITFAAADIPSDLAVGDYVVLSDTSPSPQIPVEWRPYLSHLVAAQILNSVDPEQAGVLKQELKEMKANALSMIAPRVTSKSKSIVNKG
jgi:hypothetical protein